MINTTGITDLYTALTAAITDKLDTLYTANKIDAETYAKLLAQSFDEALKLSVGAIQQQEQIEQDVAYKQAQTELLAQQKANLIIEGSNLTKQGLLIDAQKAHTEKQTLLADKEVLIKEQQVLIAEKELDIATAKALNVPKEGALLDAQTAKAVQEKLNLVTQELLLDAEIAFKNQQTANLLLEAANIPKVGCKLDGEYNLILGQIAKAAEETTLLTQKTATEKAQILNVGVDADSIVGKQKALYTAQATGFTRDAEQKAAKIMIDTWSVRRTTDEATLPGTAGLDDSQVARAVSKLLSGVGA